MDSIGLQDLTSLFLRLQEELEPAGIGQRSSLEAQLKETQADLRSWFINEDMLATGLGSGGLTYEHAFLKKYEEWSRPRLTKLLSEYRQAQNLNAQMLFDALSAFLPTMDSAYRHVVSIAELESDKSNLKAYAFARSCIRDMGDMIESTLLPFVRLRLNVLDLCGRRTGRPVQVLSLGELIREVTEYDGDIYGVGPFEVSLSQWRNVSHHSSYTVLDDKILCEVGRGLKKRTIECSQSQLIALFMDVQKIYYIHKVAYEIFSTDNIKHLIAAERASGPRVGLSELSMDATLAYGIVASGFHIEKVGRDKFRWGLLLIDRHDRSQTQCKAALQASVVPYMLHSGPIQIYAWINNSKDRHFVSFSGEMSKGPLQTDSDHSAFKLNQYLRVDDRE